MRGIRLFKPLVSNYGKASTSLGQIRHCSYGNHWEREEHINKMMCISLIVLAGVAGAAGVAYGTSTSKNNKESEAQKDQKSTPDESSTDVVKLDKESVELMLALAVLKKHPEYSIKATAEDESLCDTGKESSNPKIN